MSTYELRGWLVLLLWAALKSTGAPNEVLYPLLFIAGWNHGTALQNWRNARKARSEAAEGNA